MQGHRLAAVALAAALLAAGAAAAADIRGARYDARTDSVLVEIAYRGTHPKHDFRVQWNPCADGAAVGRLIDRHGNDAAEEEFIVQDRIGLAALPCRPALVTLRLGRTSIAQVHIPQEAPQ